MPKRSSDVSRLVSGYDQCHAQGMESVSELSDEDALLYFHEIVQRICRYSETDRDRQATLMVFAAIGFVRCFLDHKRKKP